MTAGGRRAGEHGSAEASSQRPLDTSGSGARAISASFRGSRRVDLPPHSFWETRSGAGTPVILIHGLGGSSDWWRYTVTELSKSHTVAAVDLVGFGRNRSFLRRSRLPLRFDDIAGLLARWIEESFTESIHLVGNSMGGQIAIHLAAARPDLVRSLVLVNSTGIPFEMKPARHLANLMVPPGALSFARVLARDLFRSGPTSLAVAFTRLLRDDARPQMRALTMPVLVLRGARDALVPQAYGEEMAREIPNAELRVVENAGHVPMWENPAAFNRELIAFLERVDAQQSRFTSAGSTADRRDAAFSWGISGWSEGIAHREAGRGRHLILVHGLGMSSAYFVHLARELFQRGLDPIAPDLPGFGESGSAAAAGPAEHATQLAQWANRLGIANAVWLGHSTGCHAVAHLARQSPELLKEAIFLSPLWSPARHPVRRLAGDLLLDVFREPFPLFGFVFRAYWRAGIGRWWGTFRRHLHDFRRFDPLAQPYWIAAGVRDPLVDPPHLRVLDPQADLDLPGAHAMHFSHPSETADAIAGFMRKDQGGSRGHS